MGTLFGEIMVYGLQVDDCPPNGGYSIQFKCLLFSGFLSIEVVSVVQ